MTEFKHYFGWYLDNRGRPCSVSWIEEDGTPIGSLTTTVVQVREIPVEEAFDLEMLEKMYPYKPEIEGNSSD